MDHTRVNISKNYSLSPFVLSLPSEKTKHFEILKPPNSVVMRSGYVVLKPSEEVGIHTTGEHEEVLVILDGIGEIEAEGIVRQRITKDCIVYIPPHTQHNVFNVGKQPLCYIYIVSSI
jgi:mannose-6-phosphate isomerase-like protein (cupin superfamily)